MGRKSHNLTEEQTHDRAKRWRMETYWRHVVEYRTKALKRYYDKKIDRNLWTTKQT
jgi:hypothetical protein